MTRAALQCAQMLCALGLGLSLGMFYDIYRIFIKKQHGRAWCWFGDLIWWLSALAWSFWVLVKISWADLRIPIIIAVFAGILVYLYYFSPALSHVYKRTAEITVKIIKKLFSVIIRILSIIFFPLVFITGGIYRITAFIISVISKAATKLIGKSNKLYNKKKSEYKVKKQAANIKKAEKKHSNSKNKSTKKTEKSNKRKARKRKKEKAENDKIL